MTIVVNGFVEKMETGLDVRLTLRMETKAQPIVVEAKFSEIGTAYLPGTEVQVTIVPLKKPHV